MPRGRASCHRGLHGEFYGYGYRVTAAREVILNVISKLPEHPSAEEIYLAVHKVYPRTGMTTIYRTLELLVNMGLIIKLDSGEGRARYELSEKMSKQSHHHHLVCTECKTIINYSDFIDEEKELLVRTEKGLSKKYNFDIRSHVIQFSGICGDCKKNLEAC
jgi:Fur family ferric uptake transcriptional regulator